MIRERVVRQYFNMFNLVSLSMCEEVVVGVCWLSLVLTLISLSKKTP